MILNYLYEAFDEETRFAAAAGLEPAELAALIDARVCPAASYRLDLGFRSVSFVSDHTGAAAYRFHLKGHRAWLDALRRLSIGDERSARSAFEARYGEARRAFLAGDLGRRAHAAAPAVAAGFDAERAETTWSNFLGGVYGVCTTDGAPETIFVKQYLVDFIDRAMAEGPIATDGPTVGRALLRAAVDALDGVEAAFAPHEVALSSRRRCVDDVRAALAAGPRPR